MTSGLFRTWFLEHFLPIVAKHRKALGPGHEKDRAVLLLDNHRSRNCIRAGAEEESSAAAAAAGQQQPAVPSIVDTIVEHNVAPIFFAAEHDRLSAAP